MTADERAGMTASGRYPAKPPAGDTTGATAEPEPRTRSAFGAPHNGPAARLSVGAAASADTFVRTSAVSLGLERSATTTPETSLVTGMNAPWRSEEHTSELQSHHDLVCRLLLEKKKIRKHP